MILELNKSQDSHRRHLIVLENERDMVQNAEHERIQIAQRNDTWECCTCSYPG